MAIEIIPYPEPLPTGTTDYVKQNNLIETGFLTTYRPIEVISGNIQQGSTFQCGGSYYLCTSDTAIVGVASNYIKLTPSGPPYILTPSYVANLVGVSWNQAYNGYYDVGGNLYIFDEITAIKSGDLTSCNLKLFQSIFNRDRETVGQVAFFISDTIDGWLIADGSTIDKSTNPEYTDLVDMLKAEAGADVTHPYYSANVNQAVLPDIEGRSLRAIDSSGTRDQDGTRKSGSYQADENKAHTHTAQTYNVDGNNGGASTGIVVDTNLTLFGWQSSYARTLTDGNTEATVKNISLYAMIKY